MSQTTRSLSVLKTSATSILLRSPSKPKFSVPHTRIPTYSVTRTMSAAPLRSLLRAKAVRPTSATLVHSQAKPLAMLRLTTFARESRTPSRVESSAIPSLRILDANVSEASQKARLSSLATIGLITSAAATIR